MVRTVLDADAFDAFVKTGNVYDQELAGNIENMFLLLAERDDSMELYRRFRGQDPSIEPLLERRGLN